MFVLALDGLVVKLDVPELKEMISLLRYSGNNINQIAVRVNSTGNVYADDIAEIKEGQDKIWQQLKFFQSKFLSLTH